MSVSWLPADWPAPPGVVAGTTLRTGGSSRGRFASLNLAAHVGDDPAAVRGNRTRFRDDCGLPAEPAWLRQVHGTTVVAADEPGVSPPEADASTTRRPGVVCAVLTADCLPLVLAARDGSEVAVVHAGWRGLCAGVVEATVCAMRCPAPQLLAWLGPAISQPAFEVGEEVRQQFVSGDRDATRCFEPNPRGRWQADLYGLARLRLGQSGVPEIHGTVRCTYGEPRNFFSYRRDGACGRMATFVFRRAESA